MAKRPIRALSALVSIALLAGAAPQALAADDIVAELRVVAPGGELESGTSYVTNTERIRTDRKAKCFIDGQGGSGETVKLPGPTAMGLLKTAGDVNRQLDPLSVTDEFGFGLGLCGIGEVEADTSNFWSFTVNHQAAQVGGDQFPLADEDVVLWNLTEFPPPNELELRAGPGTTPGTMNVTVVEWTCSTEFPPPPPPICTESPAQGATVTGGDSPAITNASGVATVSLATPGRYTLQATLPGRLDSNSARVCVSNEAGACPAPTDPVGRKIFGRSAGDEFSGTDGWDVIRSRAGDDVVRIRDGGSDRVRCGRGRDKVVLGAGDQDDIAGDCERVKRVA